MVNHFSGNLNIGYSPFINIYYFYGNEYFFFPVSVEHPGCLVLKGRQKSFLQEQECGIGWGRIKYMFLPVNGLNQGVMCNHVV